MLLPALIGPCSTVPPPRDVPGVDVAPPVEPPPAPAPPAPSGDIGTAHPFLLEAVDPEGRWVVACQARADTDGSGSIEVRAGHHGLYGDALAPYIIVGEGAGEPVDAYVDHSRDGRWIAAVSGGLVLIDGVDGRRTPIPDADLRVDPQASLSSRIAAFAGTDRLVYARHRPGGDAVVVRRLPQGSETEIAVPGALWRVEPDPAGHWARVLTIRRDTDGSGALEWPSEVTTLPPIGCRGPPTVSSSMGWRGDEPDVLWLDLDGGSWVEGRGVVGPAGRALVRITDDDGLAIGPDRVAPAGCRPDVHATLPDPPRALVTCRGSGRARMKLVGAGTSVDLAAEPPRSWQDTGGQEGGGPVRHLAPRERIACVETACVDLVSGAVRPIVDERDHREFPIFFYEDRMLMRRDVGVGAAAVRDQFLVDGDGKSTPIEGIDRGPDAESGALIVIDRIVVDLASRSVRGRVEGDGEIVAIDRSGRALVVNPVTHVVNWGPGRWVPSRPQTDPRAPPSTP